jgi:hypothetical protein
MLQVGGASLQATHAVGMDKSLSCLFCILGLQPESYTMISMIIFMKLENLLYPLIEYFMQTHITV